LIVYSFLDHVAASSFVHLAVAAVPVDASEWQLCDCCRPTIAKKRKDEIKQDNEKERNDDARQDQLKQALFQRIL
jgi:hypothetical protein